jgi:hypothetical protein
MMKYPDEEALWATEPAEVTLSATWWESCTDLLCGT